MSNKTIFDKRTNSKVNNIKVNDWRTWKLRYTSQIKHIAGFEEQFVDLVLSKINNIEPDDVVPQYHFNDNKGGNRYVDFMIINETKNYCLPIELDGYSKMVGTGNQYHVFNDFLERQNAMIDRFGLVLRYTNKTMLNNSQNIIDEIKRTLDQQSDVKSTELIKKRHTDQLISDYEAKIKNLNDKTRNSDSTDLMPLLKDMQKEISELRKSQETGYNDIKSIVKDDSEKNNLIKHKVNHDNQLTPLKVVSPPVRKELQKTVKPQLTKNHVLGLSAVGIIVVAIGAISFLIEPKTENFFKSDQVTTDVKEIHGSDNNIKNRTEDPSKELSNFSNTKSESYSNENAIADRVPASEVYKYTGSYKVVCGIVAQVKEFNKGIYLNIGASYPHQDATFVVWNSDVRNFGNLDLYEGTKLCIEGTIESYKGVPQIKLASNRQIR